MNYASDDLRRAERLARLLPAGVDVAPFVRALCLEFTSVRCQMIEAAALIAETCPIPSEGVRWVSPLVYRDAEIAQRIRTLK